MNTLNDVQTTNQLYQNTRSQLYDVVTACPFAERLTVSAKHELVQWAFLQWVAVNDEWTNNTERYWERQSPLPFDAALAGEALKSGITNLLKRNDVIVEETGHADITFQDALPLCQSILATLVLQRLDEMRHGAAPGLEDDSINVKHVNSQDMVL